MPIPKKDFYFLRHGQTDWNRDGRFQGHSDIPLNDVGLSQAREASAALAQCKIDVVVTSPLVRALKTAEIVASEIKSPVFIDASLKERHFGRFEGLIVNEVKAGLGVQPHERLVKQLPADAEQSHETRARTISVISKWLTCHPDSEILFVAHSGLFDALHEMIFETRLEPKHSPYRWRHNGKAWTCEQIEHGK